MNTTTKKVSSTTGKTTNKPSVKSKDEDLAVAQKVEPTKKDTSATKSEKSEDTSVVFTSRRVWPD